MNEFFHDMYTKNVLEDVQQFENEHLLRVGEAINQKTTGDNIILTNKMV